MCPQKGGSTFNKPGWVKGCKKAGRVAKFSVKGKTKENVYLSAMPSLLSVVV